MPINLENKTLRRSGLPRSDFHFKVANTLALKQKIFDSRLRIFEESFPYLIKTGNSHPAKDSFDDTSILFCCLIQDQVIASCRATPIIEDKWEVSPSMPDHVSLDMFNDGQTIQLNRVYLERGYRNQNLHVYLFFFFSQWVLKNTNYRNYFATCNAGLVRLYSSIGAKLAYPDGFKMINRGKHNYYLVHGKISDFNAIVKNEYLK